jgi:hypothetical protein
MKLNYFDPESDKDFDSYRTEMREAYSRYGKRSMRYTVFSWLCFFPGLGALYAGVTEVAVTLLILAYYFDKNSDRNAHHIDMINLHWALALLANNEAKRVMTDFSGRAS